MGFVFGRGETRRCDTWGMTPFPKSPYRVEPGTRIALSAHDHNASEGMNRAAGIAALEVEVERLYDLQALLWAENRRAVLVVFQGIDTSGKDGVIRSVFTGLNPQGCRVASFRAPSEEELAHDFLWRYHARCPRIGEIGIFNRSHYESVLVERVKKLAPESAWRERYERINEFERLLTQCGTTVLKFFLHIGRDEQKARLEARLRDPRKNWKLSPTDFEDRRLWGDYEAAFEEMLSRCSTEHAPWYIVPADRKWMRNLVVCRVLVGLLENLGMQWPTARIDLSKYKVE